MVCLETPFTLARNYQYFNVDNVCLTVTDVTSLPQRVLWERGYKVRFTTTRTLGTRLLTVAMAYMVISIAP